MIEPGLNPESKIRPSSQWPAEQEMDLASSEELSSFSSFSPATDQATRPLMTGKTRPFLLT